MVENEKTSAFEKIVSVKSELHQQKHHSHQQQQHPFRNGHDTEEMLTEKSKIECVVCGDKSSGKHYGQFTCEGCKSFFKRSVRRNLSYTCRNQKNCSIDQHHRNQCQFCRYKKCLKFGMRKEAVQRGRISNSSLASATAFNPGGLALPSPATDSFFYTSTSASFISILLRAEPYPSHAHLAYNLVQTMSQADVSCEFSPSKMIFDQINELSARLLFTSVEWAKNLSFFLQFSIDDQIKLFQNAWSHLFILNAAQCGLPLSAKFLSIGGFDTGQGHPHDSSSSSTAIVGLPRTTQQSIDILNQIANVKRLNLDASEFACLKALALFNPDLLVDNCYVETIQSQTQTFLEDYTRANDSLNLLVGPSRSSALLFRLIGIKSIDAASVTNLFFKRLVGDAPIEILIKDMLVNKNVANFNYIPR